MTNMTRQMSCKQLYFVRHGETALNASGCLQGSGTDDGLSAKGRHQAEFLRNSLEDVGFELAIVTHLVRTKETAMIVLEKHPDVPILEVKELGEISWGIMEGQPNSIVQQLKQTWDDGNFDAACPEGESPLQVESRAVPAIYSIIHSRPETKILFICKVY
jgi:broad specificity phosphatase PhoE